jgi:hypothetical protein
LAISDARVILTAPSFRKYLILSFPSSLPKRPFAKCWWIFMNYLSPVSKCMFSSLDFSILIILGGYKSRRPSLYSILNCCHPTKYFHKHFLK